MKANNILKTLFTCSVQEYISGAHSCKSAAVQRVNLVEKILQRPLYTQTGFHYIIPPFLIAFDNIENFFLHYTNDSTVTLLRNSLFNSNKQNNYFHCYKKHLKWGDEVMKVLKKVSPIIQC